jgi:hypothetical protein
MTKESAPELSIVIATTQPWPEMRLILDSVYDQAQALGAEIIVADGHGQGGPEGTSAGFPSVIWLRSPGASVYQLRSMAMAKARGQIIALTEDHCLVAPDWCRAILASHREHPDAAVIGGAVENGANTHWIDWASFFYANGASMRPLGIGECRQITQLNLSYKRRVVPTTFPAEGRMEWIFNDELRKKGEKLVADERIVVDHVQALGFQGTCRLHYQGSRAVAGFRLPHMTALERCVRLCACCVMPFVLFARTVASVLSKRRLGATLMFSLPHLALLVCIRTVGAFAGLVGGLGDSPRFVR